MATGKQLLQVYLALFREGQDDRTNKVLKELQALAAQYRQPPQVNKSYKQAHGAEGWDWDNPALDKYINDRLGTRIKLTNKQRMTVCTLLRDDYFSTLRSWEPVGDTW